MHGLILLSIINKLKTFFIFVSLGTHAAWPTVLNPQAAYQLQQQQNAIFQAVGDKNLKELAIFTGQHNDGQVSKQRQLISRQSSNMFSCLY